MKNSTNILSPKQVRRGLALSLAGSTLGMVWVAIALTMPMALYLEALGAGGIAIGLLTMLPQIAMIVQIPSTFFIERLPRRKGFCIGTALISRAVYFLPALVFFLPESMRAKAIPILLITAGVSAVIGQMSIVPWLSWMADLVPDKQRGAYWGKRQAITTVSFLAALAFSGWMLDRFPEGSLDGFALLFFIATLFGLSESNVYLLVPEPKPARVPTGLSPLQRILLPLKSRDFRLFTLAMATWGFGMAMIGQFGNVYLKQVFNLPYSELSAIAIISLVGGIVASFMASYLMDRMGARVFAVLMVLIAPLLHVAWLFVVPGEMLFGFSQATVLLSATGFLFGGVVAGVIIAQFNLAAMLTPTQGRTMAMAVHWSIVGVVSAGGPLLGGWLMNWFTAHPNAVNLHLPSGMPFTYIHALLLIHLLIVWLLSLPLFISIRTHSRDIGIPRAARNIFLANPLRVARDLYNIHISMASVPSRRKVRAVQELGDTRSPMVVADLAEMLEDPSADIREEAVTALGKIGDPEALDILLRTLEDPHQADLAPQIARALRRIRSPKSVDALTRQLREGDHETKAESVRALGEIADRRAANDLLSVLREGANDKLIGHSSEALARLNERVAVYEIFPRMRATENRVLKRSLATAIGALFGKPDQFYQLFMKEQQTPGSEIERLVKPLLKTLPEIRNFESFYEEENWPACVELLFAMATRRAQAEFGVSGEKWEMANQLTQREQSAGITLWLLAELEQAKNEVLRPVEVLLGLYVLSRWPTKK